jgi:hypothetical protein
MQSMAKLVGNALLSSHPYLVIVELAIGKRQGPHSNGVEDIVAHTRNLHAFPRWYGICRHRRQEQARHWRLLRQQHMFDCAHTQ